VTSMLPLWRLLLSKCQKFDKKKAMLPIYIVMPS
jgi:hypothetical protein